MARYRRCLRQARSHSPQVFRTITAQLDNKPETSQRTTAVPTGLGESFVRISCARNKKEVLIVDNNNKGEERILQSIKSREFCSVE